MKSPIFQIGDKVRIKKHRIGKCSQYCLRDSIITSLTDNFGGVVIDRGQGDGRYAYKTDKSEGYWLSPCMLEKVEETKGIDKLDNYDDWGNPNNDMRNRINSLIDTVNKLTKEKELEVTHDRVVEEVKVKNYRNDFKASVKAVLELQKEKLSATTIEYICNNFDFWSEQEKLI